MTDNQKEHWVPALQMSYDYVPETGMIVFTDGIKYTIDECIQIAKGKLSDDDIRAIHHVKQAFDGELVNGFGETGPEYRSRSLQGHDGGMPEKVSVPPVRPVLQEYYGRRGTARRARTRPFNDPCQGVLEL